MPTAISSVIDFLNAKIKKGTHNGPDLLERFLKYGCDMEVQVNVAAGEGEPVAGKRSTYTDGLDQWFSYRIPRNADSTPEFRDYTLDFPLDLHCDGIGSTGWDWKARRSRWVGFDFDSIVGHAAGVGVSKDELDKVRDAAQALPYVEARRSTGGAGLHLYVLFQDHEAFDTANHTQHAAIARCVLGIMSRDAGFDFQTQIDGCGGNMWIWHRKSSVANRGLELIKPATGVFIAEELPSNWQDHILVVQGKRAKVRLDGLKDEDEDEFEQLATAHRRVTPDAMHNRIADEIAAMGIVCTWHSDHHLLQTHTVGFDRLMKEKKEELKLEGMFETNSKGSELQVPNCFAYPLDHGAFKIYRFGPGCNEALTWEQDGKGWTTCGFNVRPSFKVAATALGGRPLKKGGYEFNTVKDAMNMVKALNPDQDINIEPELLDRKAVIYKTKDDKLAIQLDKEKNDPANLGLWNSSDKKGAWTQVFNASAEPVKIEVTDYDSVIRCLETTSGEPAGWSAQKADGDYTRKNAGSIKMMLQELGHPKPEAEQIMGRAEFRPWKLVMMPFQPEYPGNRQWNLGAPQLRYQPAPRSEFTDDEKGESTRHPHFDMVLEHIGQDLNQQLKTLDWAKQCGIRTGGDYLKAIFASILREPLSPTPYLFLFGPENSGKSILHEAFELLVTSGVVKADRALTNQSDFNGELDGAILCVVEEKNISKSPGAHAKIKDAVTSRRLSIRRMRTNSYMIDNMTHWLQCSNFQEDCPIFEGDTRITMMHVPQLKGAEIPKSLLLDRMKEEAPYFMRTLMDMQLPPSTGRLRIPVVSTQHKQRAEQLNRSPMDQFIAENLHEAPGHTVLYVDFYTRFIEQLPVEEKHNWSRYKVSKALPIKFASGTGNQNKTYLINASWEPVSPSDYGPPYYIAGGRIKQD